MLFALLGLLFALLASPAYAQRTLSADRVATAPLPVGRAYFLRLDAFDDAISLDPEVLELSVVDAGSVRVEGRRPGVATVLVLRGGLTESIVITVDGTPLSRETFSPLDLAPEDGVPFWRADATVRASGGTKTGPPVLTQVYGGMLGYNSEAAGVSHLSQVLMQSSGDGFGFRNLQSTTTTRRFDLTLGDVFFTPTPGRSAFSLRGLQAALRPTGDTDLEADLTVGNTRQLVCCSIFDEQGEVVAVAGAAKGYGVGRTRVFGGVLVPRTDPEILPLAGIEQTVEAGPVRARATAARVGGGYTSTLAVGVQGERSRARLVGYINGRDAWMPSNGPATRTESWVLANGEHRFTSTFAMQADGSVRNASALLDSTTVGTAGLGAIFGSRARLALRYGVALGWEDGLPSRDLFRHQVQSAFAMQTRSRFRLNSSLNLAFDRALQVEQAQWRLFALSELGPILRFGPYAWGVATGGSGVAGAGARLLMERARVESLTALGLQTGFGADGLSNPRALLEGRVGWAFSGWGSVFAGGNLITDLTDLELAYTVNSGVRLGGNLRDVRGAVLGGGVVTGTVFVDVDGDGRLGPSDYGVQGVEVTVLDRTAVSGEGGRYRIRGLKPGVFRMGVDSSGYLLSVDEMAPVGVSGSRKAVVDIPLVEKRRVDVHVFVDRNDNKVLDVGEWDVPAELITLTGPEGTRSLQAPDGHVTIEGLPLGEYEIELNTALLDAGYLPTGLTRRTVYVDRRGFQRVLFPVRPVRRIAGRVCRDANDNGRLDGADVCEAGLTVSLATGETQKTGPDGSFAFEPVPPGDQRVRVGNVESEPIRVTEYPVDHGDVRLLLPYVQPPSPSPTSKQADSALVALRLQLEQTDLKVGERIGFEVTGTFANLLQMRIEKPDLVVADHRVAKVVGGALVAVGEGRTQVEAFSGKVRSPGIEIEVRRLPVVGLVARPARLEVPFGDVATVGATAIFVDGDSQEVGDRVDWRCEDPQVCRVEGNGVFVATGPGTTILRADYLGVASQPVEVRVTTGDAVPTEMAVNPPQLTLGLQSSGRVYVDARLSNGRDVHLTTEVEWATDSPDVIAILPGGRIKPVSVGRATVTATFKGVESTRATIEVVPAVGLVVVPTIGVVPAGVSVPVRLFEVLGDGTYQEVTKGKWTSADPAIADIQEGRLLAGQVGTTSLVARYRGNESLPMEVQVVGTALAGLRATAESILVEADEVAYVDALATFRDGRETVATSVVTWEVRDPGIAKVSEDGEITGLKPGRTVVTGSWLGWSTPPVEILVGAGISEVPDAILVEPATVSISAQGAQPLAVSVLSESGRLLGEKNVRWEVGDPSVAWVEKNEVRAVAVGNTEIVAVQGDVRSLPVPVEVRPIVGITADPPLGRLPVGARVELRALAVVDDGSAERLDGGVQWSSSDPDILRIDGNGELLAFKAGRANVVATWRNMKTLPMPVEVADTDLVSLAVQPAEASVRADETLPLAVVAVFGDGAQADGTPHVTWTSTRPSVATAKDGLLAGVEPGVAEVFATWMGLKSPPIRVTVAPVDAVGVILGNASEVVLLGRRFPLRATAVTADGKLLDASEQTLWGVSDTDVVQVDANGYLEALAPGETTLVGVVGGEESPAVRVEVTGVAVLRVDVEPGALAVRPDDPVELVVRATLADGRTIDVTPQVDWEIDGRGVAVDRYNHLVVGHGARARVRARIDDVRSGWAEIVSTE
ncbi:MAG: Ig-like domain-containing protein [Alphaproteobacteria bacterium]|nr:Ig-like domain-containing protein [Alphaproteobacteria bacterium]